jgi:hypothetical protein
VPTWGDANLLEAVWTWMGFFGFGLSVRLAWLIDRSIDRLKASGLNGLRVDVARTRKRNQVGRALVFLGFATIGWIALFLPTAPTADVRVGAFLSGVVLIGCQSRMLYDSVRDNIDRERQLGRVAQLDAADAGRGGARGG